MEYKICEKSMIEKNFESIFTKSSYADIYSFKCVVVSLLWDFCIITDDFMQGV